MPRGHEPIGSHVLTPDAIAVAPVSDLVAAAITLCNAYDPTTARALLRRFPDIAAGEDGQIVCRVIAAHLAAPQIAALRESGELWSEELDTIACALEGLVADFPCLLDGGPLLRWLDDDVRSRAEFAHPSEVAHLLAYRSDSLAYAVCYDAPLASVPDLAPLLLAHRPGVLTELHDRMQLALVPTVAILVRAYRDRLRDATAHDAITCETAAVAMRLHLVLASYANRGKLIELGVTDARDILPTFTASEIRHLARVADMDQPPAGNGKCPRVRCGLADLLAMLARNTELLASPDVTLELYDALLPRISRNRRQFRAGLAGVAYELLATDNVAFFAALDRALRLEPDALACAAPYLARRPLLFTDPTLRERLRDIDSPIVRYALVLHSPADQVGEHLRWLLANAPEVALAAIEDRTHDIAEAVEMRELLPLLKVEDANARARAQALLHRWRPNVRAAESSQLSQPAPSCGRSR